MNYYGVAYAYGAKYLIRPPMESLQARRGGEVMTNEKRWLQYIIGTNTSTNNKS